MDANIVGIVRRAPEEGLKVNSWLVITVQLFRGTQVFSSNLKASKHK